MKKIYLMTSYLAANDIDVYTEQLRGLLAQHAIDVRPTMDHVDAVVVILNSRQQSRIFFEDLGLAKKKKLPVFYILQAVVAERVDPFTDLKKIDPAFNQSMHYSFAELVSPESNLGQFLNYRDPMYPKIQRILVHLQYHLEFFHYLLEQNIAKELLETYAHDVNLTSQSIVHYQSIIHALVNPTPKQDGDNLTFLEHMVAHNEVAIVRDLVKANSKMVNSIKIHGHSCAEMAAEDKQHEMLKVLCVAGADLKGIKPECLQTFDKIYPGLRAPSSHDALGQSQIPAGQPQQLAGQKRKLD